MEKNKNQDEIGALWTKLSKNGTEYLSGTILGTQVVMFPVRGGGANTPSWRVLKSRPRPSGPRDPGASF